MKKAFLPSFLSCVLVLLLAFFIGRGIKHSSYVRRSLASADSEASLLVPSESVEDVSFLRPENDGIPTETEADKSAEQEDSAEKVTSADPAFSAEGTEDQETRAHNVGSPVIAAPEDKNAVEPERIPSGTLSEAGKNSVIAGETVVDALFDAPYIFNLSSSSSVVTFRIRVSERGALSYRMSTVAETQGNWNAELFQEYSVNGCGPDTALRTLNVLGFSGADSKASSPNIGLMPGDYLIKVTSGDVFSSAYFVLNIGFSASTGYEIEYNDTRTRYTEIYPGVDMKGSASLYSSGYDADWFMFRNYSDACFRLSFSHEEMSFGTVAFKVSLYNSDMTELFSGNSLFLTSVLKSGSLGLPEGIYFISVVSRVYTDVDYTLSLARSAYYAFETEGNDGVGSADSLRAGESVRGALSLRSGASDVDYYSFTAESDGYIKTVLTNTQPSSAFSGYVRRLRVFDVDGNVIYSVLTADSDDVLSSPEIGICAGTYYIVIDDSDLYHSSDDYELCLSFTETNGWEKEYNGTPGCATHIFEDIPVSGTVADAGTDFDTDYYVISAESAGTMAVSFSHAAGITNNETFRITVYDASLNPVGSALISFDGSQSVSGEFAVSKGTYYIKVTSGSYSSDVRYYLTCSFREEV